MEVEQMDDWPDLSRVDWFDLYPRLLLNAKGRIRRLWWPRDKPQAQDFVQRAILKALSGDRTYDRKKTLLENLCQIISSEISHETQSYDTKNVTSEDETIVNTQDYRGESPEDTTYYLEMVPRYLDFLGSHDRVARDIADLMLNRYVTESKELRGPAGAFCKRNRECQETTRPVDLNLPRKQQRNRVKILGEIWTCPQKRM